MQVITSLPTIHLGSAAKKVCGSIVDAVTVVTAASAPATRPSVLDIALLPRFKEAVEIEFPLIESAARRAAANVPVFILSPNYF